MSRVGRIFWLAVTRVVLLAGFVGGTGALVGGAAFGWAMSALVVFAGFTYHAWKLSELSIWLSAAEPSSIHPSEVPEGLGVWGETLTQLYRVLRQQRASLESLSDALARFQQAASALPDGAVMLDHDLNLVWCNPTAERHWQISMERDRYQTITYFIRYPEFQPYLVSKNFVEPLTLRLSRADSIGALQEIVLVAQLVAFGDDQMLLLSRDVSERERLETMRRDFVANVSHELRTPLTVMSGFVETLRHAPSMTAAQTARALAHMETQATRMRRLVDDLLTLSQLEDTQNRLVESAIPILPLLREVVADATDLSAGRHTITLSGVDAILLGNREELFSALSNLVTNAVRYTQDGGEIRVETCEGDNGTLVMSVADNGEGIPAVHLPRLTERFYRVDRSRSREGGGTGLGLAIVKHVVLRHGAELKVESRQEADAHGSTFRIVFPASRRVVTEASDVRMAS